MLTASALMASVSIVASTLVALSPEAVSSPEVLPFAAAPGDADEDPQTDGEAASRSADPGPGRDGDGAPPSRDADAAGGGDASRSSGNGDPSAGSPSAASTARPPAAVPPTSTPAPSASDGPAPSAPAGAPTAAPSAPAPDPAPAASRAPTQAPDAAPAPTDAREASSETDRTPDPAPSGSATQGDEVVGPEARPSSGPSDSPRARPGWTWCGRPTAVADGDTIDACGVTIRLPGANAMERGTVGFEDGREQMVGLSGAGVWISDQLGESNGREVRQVLDAQERDISLLLLLHGWADLRYFDAFRHEWPHLADGYLAAWEEARAAGHNLHARCGSDARRLRCGSARAADPAPSARPAPAAEPSPTAAPPSRSDCDPNYRGPCVPRTSHDLDCKDIGYEVQVVGADPHRFDGDNDGWGCESKPCYPGGDYTATCRG